MEALNLTAVVGVYHPERGLHGGGHISEMTSSFNLPGLVMPAGWWSKADDVKRRDPREYVYPLDNMPFGLEFIGKRWHEHELLKIGRAYEKAVGGPQIWRQEGWKRLRKDVNVVSGWE
ncbi:hypothetical protein FRB97_004931 [Tulasnella sp. 331]|nr:hypothetical protein FRB97_004931 [Tulasnella sp. 331]